MATALNRTSLRPGRRILRANTYRWYDATIGSGRPIPFPDPWLRCNFDDRHPFPDDDQTNYPDETLSRDAADYWFGRDEISILDYEEGYTAHDAYPSETDDTIALITDILQWENDQQSTLPFGMYAIAPTNEFLRAEANDAGWIESAEYLQILARKCDFIVPSFRVFYADMTRWSTFVTNFMVQARRYQVGGAPAILPLIDPRYAPGAGGGLANTYVGDTSWQLILDTVRDVCDGAILWETNAFNSGTAFYTLANAMAQADL